MSMNANDPNTVPITVGANDGSTLIIAAAAAAAADSMRLKPHDPDELVPDADEVVKPYAQIQFVVVPAVWPKMSIDAMAQQKKVEETVAAVAVHLFSDGDGEILPDWLESVPFGMASVRAYVVKGKRREDRDSFDGVMVVDVVEDHLDRWCSSFDEESGFIRIVAPHELHSSPEIVTPIFWLQAPGQGLAAAVVAITKAVREAHEGDEAADWFPAVIRDDPRHPDQVGIMMSMLNATFLALYKEPVAVPTKAGIIQVRPVLPAGAIAEGKESFIVYGVTGFGTQRALEQMVARKTGVDPGEIECYSMGGGTQRGVMLCNYPFTDIAFSAILALTDPATGPIACPVPGVEQRSVTFWCALNMPELEQKASRILMRDASTVRAGNTKEALENKMQEAIQRALTNNQAPELSAGGGAGARLPRRWRPWAAGLMAAALALLGAAAARPTAHPQAAHPPAPVSWQREGSVHDGGRPAPADTRTGEVSGEVGGVCVWFANSGDWHDCVIRPGLVPAGGERPRPPWRRSEPSLRTCQRDGGGGGRNVGGSVALAETSAGGAAAVCATGKAALLGCCSPRGYPTGADGRGGGWDCGAGDGVMAEPDDRAAPESQNALLGGIDEEVRPRPQPQGLQCAGADVAGAGRRGRLRDRGEMELSKTPRESMNDRVDGGGRRWQANVVVAKLWRRQITEERDDELVDVTLLDLQTRDRGSVRIVPTHIDGMMVDDVAPVVLAAAKAKRPLAKRSFRGVVTRHRRPKSMQGPAVCIMGGECSVWPAAGLKAGACEKCGRAPQWGGAAAVDRGTASRTGGAKTAASESGTRDAGGGGAGLHAPERPAVIAPPMGPQPSADGSGARHSVGGALGTLPPGVVGAPEAVPGGPGALRGGLGGGLVGRRLLIQWRGDPGCPWFAGVVDRPPREGRWPRLHRVAYDDGDIKWHDIGAEERAGQLHWEDALQAGRADFPAFDGGCVGRRPERGRSLTPVERGQSKEYSSDSDGDGPWWEARPWWRPPDRRGTHGGPPLRRLSCRRTLRRCELDFQDKWRGAAVLPWAAGAARAERRFTWMPVWWGTDDDRWPMVVALAQDDRVRSIVLGPRDASSPPDTVTVAHPDYWRAVLHGGAHQVEIPRFQYDVLRAHWDACAADCARVADAADRIGPREGSDPAAQGDVRPGLMGDRGLLTAPVNAPRMEAACSRFLFDAFLQYEGRTFPYSAGLSLPVDGASERMGMSNGTAAVLRNPLSWLSPEVTPAAGDYVGDYVDPLDYILPLVREGAHDPCCLVPMLQVRDLLHCACDAFRREAFQVMLQFADAELHALKWQWNRWGGRGLSGAFRACEAQYVATVYRMAVETFRGPPHPREFLPAFLDAACRRLPPQHLRILQPDVSSLYCLMPLEPCGGQVPNGPSTGAANDTYMCTASPPFTPLRAAAAGIVQPAGCCAGHRVSVSLRPGRPLAGPRDCGAWMSLEPPRWMTVPNVPRGAFLASAGGVTARRCPQQFDELPPLGDHRGHDEEILTKEGGPRWLKEGEARTYAFRGDLGLMEEVNQRDGQQWLVTSWLRRQPTPLASAVGYEQYARSHLAVLKEDALATARLLRRCMGSAWAPRPEAREWSVDPGLHVTGVPAQAWSSGVRVVYREQGACGRARVGDMRWWRACCADPEEVIPMLWQAFRLVCRGGFVGLALGRYTVGGVERVDSMEDHHGFFSSGRPSYMGRGKSMFRTLQQRIDRELTRANDKLEGETRFVLRVAAMMRGEHERREAGLTEMIISLAHSALECAGGDPWGSAWLAKNYPGALLPDGRTVPESAAAVDVGSVVVVDAAVQTEVEHEVPRSSFAPVSDRERANLWVLFRLLSPSVPRDAPSSQEMEALLRNERGMWDPFLPLEEVLAEANQFYGVGDAQIDVQEREVAFRRARPARFGHGVVVVPQPPLRVRLCDAAADPHAELLSRVERRIYDYVDAYSSLGLPLSVSYDAGPMLQEHLGLRRAYHSLCVMHVGRCILTPLERMQSKKRRNTSEGDGPTYHEATGTWTSGTAGEGEEGSSTVEYSPAPSTVGDEEEEGGSAGAEAIRRMVEEAYPLVRPVRWMVPPGRCGVRVTRRMRSFMGDAATLPHSVPVFSHYGFRCGSRPRWNGRLEYCALAPPHRLNFGPGYVDGEYRVGYHSIAWYRRQFNEQLTVESVVNSDDGGNSEDDGEAAPSYQVPDVRPDPRLRFSDWQARSTMLRADFTAVAELDFETGQWQLLSQYDFHTRLLTRESGELGASRDEASYLGGDYGWHLTRHSRPQPWHEGERMFRYVEPYHEADELPPLGDHTRRFGAAALRMLCLGNLGMPHRQSWEEGPDCYNLLSLHLEDSVLPVEVEELFSQGDLVRTLPWPRRDAQRLEADDRGRREAAGWLVPEAGRLHRIVEGRGVHLATVRVVVCGTAYHVPADFGYMERVHDSQGERPGAQGPDQYSPSSGELLYEAVLRLEVSRFDVAIDRLQDAAWRSRMHARRCRKEADRREAAMTEMIVWLALRVIEEGLVRAGRGVVRVPTLVELAEAASRQANVLPTLLLGRDLSQAGFSKRDPVSHVQDGHMERYGGRGYGHVRHRKCEASRVVIPGGAPRLGKPCSHYQHCEGTPIARPGWIAEYDEPMFDCQGGYNPWGNAPDPRYCYDARQARREHLDVRRAYHSLAVLHVWQQTDGRSVRVTPAARAMDKGVDSRATPDDDESPRLFVDEAAAAAAREPPGEWTEEQLAMAAEQLEEDGLLHHAGARHCLGEVDDEDWDM